MVLLLIINMMMIMLVVVIVVRTIMVANIQWVLTTCVLTLHQALY